MLTLVPTPIGNLADMTPRAVSTMKEAAVVYCEDTRRTRRLTSYFGIRAPLLRYNEHDFQSLRALRETLEGGKSAALVCDGGMPVISDPGQKIVSICRGDHIPVTALPGPSAVTAALAASGLPADSFVFLGFLPRSVGRQKRILSEAAALGRTIAIYESPFRVRGLLETLLDVLGPKAQAAMVRELSKAHEEWFYGSLDVLFQAARQRETLLGEFVVMVHPREAPIHELED